MGKKFTIIALLQIFSFVILPGCEDAVRDNFPKRQFVGFFDLRDPRYDQTVFTARRDMDGTQVGINGIVVYHQGNDFFAFDLMCPYETKSSCSVQVNPDEDATIAVCECCESRFLLASPYGEKIEGPANRGLQKYDAHLNQNGILVVKSTY